MTVRQCTALDCSREVRAKGLCNMHYQRMAKHGSLDYQRPSEAVESRFWRKVDATGECWIWTALLTPFGHGVINMKTPDGWRPMIASRVSYEMAYGRIPAGLMVRHKCDNPACVRPEHLELGTHDDNMRDMRERHRSASGERHSQARLTMVRVRDIRARLAGGETRASIARDIGVSASAIDDVANGKTWIEVA